MIKSKTINSKKLLELSKKGEEIQAREYNVFDLWVKKRKKMFLKRSDIENFKGEINRKVLSMIDSNETFDILFRNRKRKLKESFYRDVVDSIVDLIDKYNEELDKCSETKRIAQKLKTKIETFEEDVKVIERLLDKLQEGDLSQILNYYLENQSFDMGEIERIIKKRYGLKDFLFMFTKILEAKLRFVEFINKYKDDTLYADTLELMRMPYGVDVGYILFLKMNTIANLDFETSEVWGGKIVCELKKLDKEMDGLLDGVKNKTKLIEKIENDFKSSTFFDDERAFMEKYITEKRKKIIANVEE